jgi:hypothetical protein
MFSWTHNVAAPTGQVRFGIDWQIVKPNGTVISGTENPILSSVPARYASQQVDLTTPIAGTNVSNGDLVVCRLWRDGKNTQDTFTGSAFLLGGQLFFQSDSFGASAAP